MTWFGYVFVVTQSVCTLVTVTEIGKPRRPLTSGVATLVVLTSALLIWGAATVGTTH